MSEQKQEHQENPVDAPQPEEPKDQKQPENQPENNVASEQEQKEPQKDEQEDKQKDEGKKDAPKKRRRNAYRLEEQKVFQIYRRHSDVKDRVRIVKDISFALLGRRRFRRVELHCSLNILFTALKISSLFHTKIAGLYMIVELDKTKYTQFEDEKDDKGVEKEDSFFRITLTKYPTENDRKNYGFHQAFKEEDIKDPFKIQINKRKTEKRQDRRKRDDNRDRNRDRQPNRENNRRKNKDNGRNHEKGGQTYYYDYDRNNKKNQNGGSYHKDYKNQKQVERDDRPYRQGKREKDEYTRHQRLPRRDYREERQGQEKTKYESKPKVETVKNADTVKDKPKYQPKRGETKSRGAGRIASHSYRDQHLKKNVQEDRGDRNPRKHRYIEEEQWE